jgi:hypothetical protein
MGNHNRLGVMIWSAFLMLASNAKAQEQAPAPVYNEGDVWVFRVTEQSSAAGKQGLDASYKVVYKNGKLTLSLPGGGTPETKQNLPQVKSMLGGPTDKKQLLQFPLSVGKVWSAAFQTEAKGTSVRTNWNAETKVTGTEQITTPAGTFRVFKIERYETGRKNKKKGRDKRASYTYYYSPEARGIVKFSHEHGEGAKNIELVKYVPAK